MSRTERSQARRALIAIFVAAFDDDPALTHQTDLEEAVLHLPDDRQREARILLTKSDVEASHVRLRDLFTKDPESY
jgi:hypothetical protein